MIVSCGKPNRYRKTFRAAEEFRARVATLRTSYAQAQQKSRPRKAQAAEGMPRTDRDETDFEYGCGLSLGLISPITSSRPGHTRVSPSARTWRGVEPAGWRTNLHPLVGASALHGVSGFSSGSHLGSTLSPGRAVLTRGISRRSGSVAYIRADASPTEVLASPSWHQKRCRSNMIEKYLTSAQHRRRSERTRRESTAGPGTGTHHFRSRPPRLDVCPPHCRITESQQPLIGCTPSRGNRCRSCAIWEARCLKRGPCRNAPTR